MAVKRLELSESEFLRRVDHRSRSRYDEPFPESLLDDLQKDDLIPELERSGNEGLSPKYFATWRHYRRADSPLLGARIPSTSSKLFNENCLSSRQTLYISKNREINLSELPK